jgi:hypothetical protein
MSELFGTFSEPPNLATGDPYKKPKGETKSCRNAVLGHPRVCWHLKVLHTCRLNPFPLLSSYRCHWALGRQAVQHCPAQGRPCAGCVSGQASQEQCTGTLPASTQHMPCSSSRCRPAAGGLGMFACSSRGSPEVGGLKTVCVPLLLQGDRYIDAWILDKRLNKKPGTPLSNKPFHCRVGAATGSIR